jgi:molybdate transport system ATP-binding protein
MSLIIDIKKKLTNFTLEVSLEANGSRIGILGASGCGKSMTLKCVAGIETPDEGVIVINGVTVFDSAKGVYLRPQERRTGYLFQNYALFPTMTVAENIGIAIRDKDRKSRDAIVADIVQRLGLCGLEGSRPARLSGGQQQRVALARMLVSSPAILMLDEPFSALDSFLRAQVERELVETIDSFSGTVLFVSHNRDEIYRICDEVAVMNEGRFESVGSKAELFDNPRTVTAARLSGCKNLARAKKIGATRIVVHDWSLELETGRAVPDDIAWAGIRAHHIRTVAPNRAGQAGENTLPPNTFAFYVEQKSMAPFSITEYITVDANTERRIVALCRETSREDAHECNAADSGDPDKLKPNESCARGDGTSLFSIPPEKILLLRD